MSSSPLSLASNCAAAWPPSHVCGVASWPFTGSFSQRTWRSSLRCLPPRGAPSPSSSLVDPSSRPSGRSVRVLNQDGNIISNIRHDKAVDLASGSEVFAFR